MTFERWAFVVGITGAVVACLAVAHNSWVLLAVACGFYALSLVLLVADIRRWWR